MKKAIRSAIEMADARAFATIGPHGLNVVPVSVVDVYGDEIYVYDFFMQKSAENIQADPRAVLACWKGFSGVQIKAKAVYEIAGPAFDGATIKMKDMFPERTLQAVIRLIPYEVYEVKPGASGRNLLG